MELKTCLLVTDDPDDHQAFSEALGEISSNTILIIILDSEKARMLLEAKLHQPDYIFIDLSMHDIHISEFISAVNNDPQLAGIPTVLYGEEDERQKLGKFSDLPFFSKDYNYGDLRNFLVKIFQL